MILAIRCRLLELHPANEDFHALLVGFTTTSYAHNPRWTHLQLGVGLSLKATSTSQVGDLKALSHGGCSLCCRPPASAFLSLFYVTDPHFILPGDLDETIDTTMAIYLTALLSSLASNLPYIFLALLFYFASLAVYRLYFSPLAHVPGPKLAAVTTLYEFYHDCIRLGQFVFHLNELHEQYGMKMTTCYSQ